MTGRRSIDTASIREPVNYRRCPRLHACLVAGLRRHWTAVSSSRTTVRTIADARRAPARSPRARFVLHPSVRAIARRDPDRARTSGSGRGRGATTRRSMNDRATYLRVVQVGLTALSRRSRSRPRSAGSRRRAASGRARSPRPAGRGSRPASGKRRSTQVAYSRRTSLSTVSRLAPRRSEREACRTTRRAAASAARAHPVVAGDAPRPGMAPAALGDVLAVRPRWPAASRRATSSGSRGRARPARSARAPSRPARRRRGRNPSTGCTRSAP